MAKLSSAVIAAAFVPEDVSAGPLHRQLCGRIRTQILKGALPPGARLPSTRTLANDLQLSRNTVAHAFDQLRSEGYLESDTGSGTYVAREFPGRAARLSQRERQDRPVQWSRIGQQLQRMPRDRGGREYRPLQAGMPALDEVPRKLWFRLMTKVTRSTPLLGYDRARGYEPLRRALANYLSVARGAVCDRDQIIIVSGTQQALDLCARLLLNPGDSVLLEEPGYYWARAAFQAALARIESVRIQPPTPEAPAGKWELPPRNCNARLAYLTPSNQFPTGITMSAGQRLEWLAWADKVNGYILEDDYDGEFRFNHRPSPSLHSLDKNGSVILVGSFSKVLFPALRAGYLVVPSALADVFAQAKAVSDFHGQLLDQAALAAFFEEGHFPRHVRRVRNLYGERASVLLDAMQREFGRAVQMTKAESGMHVAAIFTERVDDVHLCEAASAAGVSATPLSPLYFNAPRTSGMLLGFAGYKPQAIRDGVQRLAAVYQSVRKGRNPKQSTPK